MVDNINSYVVTARQFIVEKFSHLSAEAVGWLAAVFMHCATIPSTLALLTGMSDRMPTLDVVLFVWGGLLLLFLKALINKDMLNIITIGFGFFIQAVLLALVVFR